MKSVDSEVIGGTELLEIINKSQGILEFTMDGIIINCNQVFLNYLGYTIEQLEGEHHSILFDDTYISSSKYKLFLEKLKRGETVVDEYTYIGINGNTIYAESSYNPIINKDGKLTKILTVASDITNIKLTNTELTSKITALNYSQGIIEFNMDGFVITANEKFLDIIGYSLEEIEGKHHRMFCDEVFSQSAEYSMLWEKLNRGDFDSGEYKRIGKNGKKTYIQATYNPILDINKIPVKVIKFASDVTDRKLKDLEFEGRLEAIDKSQGTIEFNMDGTVISANDKFLDILGYSLEEVVDRHHRMFCEESFSRSQEYTNFWEKMNSGQFETGEYKRIGKNGREAYIQATYNPIFDLNNKPIKVLKIASDVTEKKRRENENAKQAALIMDMSTPVMRLWDNVLLLPIIGLVDSKRVQTIMESALQNILDHQAKFLILDIQGVPAIDSAVANYLIKVTQATKLMGCRCIVTGISPQISQALVNLGIDLGDILTQSNLKDGVSMSLEKMGLKLGRTDI